MPISGCTSDETEAPDIDMSMTKQPRVLPSAKVRVECGFAGMMRTCLLPSGMLGFFRFFSSQVSLLDNFSRFGWVMASSSRKPRAVMSLIWPSSLPKSPK
jgi:hypothetical protein